MHSSRMRTACSLTIFNSRSICLGGVRDMHAPNHAHPPQPHMTPTTTHDPHNHAHPPQPCMPPATTYAPPLQPRTPPLWTESQTPVKI